ncbi:hypothetical protein WMW72_32760 [Paenibacillus filicis]|uniref:Uncharacterized protein n=1 Tax=Paenibacillus filicis TaxID=669464 RepID=A0ABU9DX13_9BACL
MSSWEITKNKQGLLLLTGAVIQLIQASTFLKLDHRFQREISMLAYHRVRQIELLNELFEVIRLRTSALLACGEFTSTISEIAETARIEASVSELMTQFLVLPDIGAFPKEAYILSMERLREKMTPGLPATGLTVEAEVTTSQAIGTLPESKKGRRLNRGAVNPILKWTKLKKNTKSVKKKNTDSFQIQIGSQTYNGFF